MIEQPETKKQISLPGVLQLCSNFSFGYRKNTISSHKSIKVSVFSSLLQTLEHTDDILQLVLAKLLAYAGKSTCGLHVKGPHTPFLLAFYAVYL